MSIKGAILPAIAIVGGLVVWMEVIVPQGQQKLLDDAYTKVVQDSEQQYEIAKRQGDKMAVCVQAMGVAAAHLQAKDEQGYRAWKSREAEDCASAGMPRVGQ
ncbi:hypothetical protein [uncultured Pseudacidovorax sp.]|uniref:hypothetical protein n=1 Tax=uncultured Pseudacidovorax sp. TaxID=679313 RepID=UPI0025D65B9C|nr:hypothetical protein [uncultured Pseudacidovorax sp.]